MVYSRWLCDDIRKFSLDPKTQGRTPVEGLAVRGEKKCGILWVQAQGDATRSTWSVLEYPTVKRHCEITLDPKIRGTTPPSTVPSAVSDRAPQCKQTVARISGHRATQRKTLKRPLFKGGVDRVCTIGWRSQFTASAVRQHALKPVPPLFLLVLDILKPRGYVQILLRIPASNYYPSIRFLSKIHGRAGDRKICLAVSICSIADKFLPLGQVLELLTGVFLEKAVRCR